MQPWMNRLKRGSMQKLKKTGSKQTAEHAFKTGFKRMFCKGREFVILHGQGGNGCMANKRKKKKTNRLVKFLGRGFIALLLLFGAGSLAVLATNDVFTYFQLRDDIEKNQAILEETSQTQQELEETRKNLTNPDYLEFVARGKYHVSRYGEQVFVFPNLNEEENTSESSADDQTSAQNGQ